MAISVTITINNTSEKFVIGQTNWPSTPVENKEFQHLLMLIDTINENAQLRPPALERQQLTFAQLTSYGKIIADHKHLTNEDFPQLNEIYQRLQEQYRNSKELTDYTESIKRPPVLFLYIVKAHKLLELNVEENRKTFLMAAAILKDTLNINQKDNEGLLNALEATCTNSNDNLLPKLRQFNLILATMILPRIQFNTVALNDIQLDNESKLTFTGCPPDALPSTYFCAITGEVLNHPVTLPNTPKDVVFERSTIEKIIADNQKHPYTREEIKNEDITPLPELEAEIKYFLKEAEYHANTIRADRIKKNSYDMFIPPNHFSKEKVQQYIANARSKTKAISEIELTFRKAAFKGDFNKIARLLSTNDININATGNSGRSALHFAVKGFNQATTDNKPTTHYLSTIRKLIAHGADLTQKDKQNNRPIDFATESSVKQFMTAIESSSINTHNNSDTNTASTSSTEPLTQPSTVFGRPRREASESSIAPTLQSLLNKYSHDKSGNSAVTKEELEFILRKSASQHDDEAVHYLLNKLEQDDPRKPDVNAAGKRSGRTALHFAIRAIRKSVEEGDDNNIPLIISNYNIIKSLIMHGANETLKDKQGKVPLDYVPLSLSPTLIPIIENTIAIAKQQAAGIPDNRVNFTT